MTKWEKSADFHMTLTAVLLAGGQSQRMGRDKATITFRGQPLWQRQIELLRSLRPEKIFVSVQKEPSWLPLETELLLDEPPSRGPLSGLTRGLASMQTSHLAVLAVDMPFMTSEQMQGLCCLATAGRGVIPVVGEHAEPLVAMYPREAVGDFAAALASNDFSLQRLSRSLVQLDKLRIFEVPQRDEGLYRSVNEPADFKEGRFPNRPPETVGGLETAAP
jgi:molybdopterin-guanine dinucleotide biosynthesis protein A